MDDPSVKGLETHNILKQVYKVFNENDVVIPFPQRDMLFLQNNDNQIERQV